MADTMNEKNEKIGAYIRAHLLATGAIRARERETSTARADATDAPCLRLDERARRVIEAEVDHAR